MYLSLLKRNRKLFPKEQSLQRKRKTYTSASRPLFLKRRCNGGTMNLTFFAVEASVTGGGRSRIRPKIFRKMPSSQYRYQNLLFQLCAHFRRVNTSQTLSANHCWETVHSNLQCPVTTITMLTLHVEQPASLFCVSESMAQSSTAAFSGTRSKS